MRCKDLLRFNKQVHVPLHLSLLSNLFQFNYSNNINRNYTSLTLCYNCHFPIQTLFHNQNLSLPTLQSPYITISSFALFPQNSQDSSNDFFTNNNCYSPYFLLLHSCLWRLAKWSCHLLWRRRRFGHNGYIYIHIFLTFSFKQSTLQFHFLLSNLTCPYLL